jgi:hypothetical protein
MSVGRELAFRGQAARHVVLQTGQRTRKRDGAKAPCQQSVKLSRMVFYAADYDNCSSAQVPSCSQLLVIQDW